jgi:glycosyltransferase involved in cell wall biosynthesis
VVIPAYNESDCVDELARRLQALMKVEAGYDFEVIVVENAASRSCSCPGTSAWTGG